MDLHDTFILLLLYICYFGFCYLLEFTLLNLVLRIHEFSLRESALLALLVCGGSLPLILFLALVGLRGFHPLEGMPLDLAVGGCVGIAVGSYFLRGAARRDMILLHGLFVLLWLLLIVNGVMTRIFVETNLGPGATGRVSREVK